MLLETIRPDLANLAEGALVLLDSLSVVFVLVVAYIVFVGNPLRNDEMQRSRAASFAIAIGFVAICAFTFGLAHFFLNAQHLLRAIAALVVGACVAVAFYFALVRPLLKPADNRIPYTMMVWSALTLLTITALVFIQLGRDRFQFEIKGTLTTESAVQLASIVISAAGIVFTYIMKSDQSVRTARQQIYQTLELQSIELFRFECDHSDLVEGLWIQDSDNSRSPAEKKVFDYRMRQYICQMLNLFEMAYRFRVQNVMPPDVFGSWVIWMWELAGAKVFQLHWTDDSNLPSNYVKDYRAAMQSAVEIWSDDTFQSDDARRDEFFSLIAKALQCKEVRLWFADSPSLRKIHSPRKLAN